MEKIQKILNKGWKPYNKNHKVLGYKKKAITAIADCKTGAIGAHKYVCDECGYEEIAYITHAEIDIVLIVKQEKNCNG